jgi:hypothetical protein
MAQMLEHQSTEGERIIAYFLDEQGIKYEKEVEIRNLQGDSKAYRIADFYLPKFRVFVEFLGQWDHPDYKKAYKEKMDTYEYNEKPCIYIYPDNLGTLNDIFRMRLQEQLNKFPELKWQRFLFKFDKLRKFILACLTLWTAGVLLIIVIGNILNKRLIIDSFVAVAIVFLTIVVFALFIYIVKQIFITKKKTPKNSKNRS